MSIEFPSIGQLKRAMAIEEQIATLQAELRSIFANVELPASTTSTTPKTKKDRRSGKRSPATRAKMAAAQKARWAKKAGAPQNVDSAQSAPAAIE